MALTILTNIPALQATSRLAFHTAALNINYEQLGSGDRINHAKDDPSGLSLSERLRLDIRTSNYAIRNANDAISLISITDGALGEIGNILTRLAELAEQSSNGIYNPVTRQPLQEEFRVLQSEITRIAKVVTFNDIHLLSQTANSPFPIRFQVGIDGSSSSQISYDGVEGTLNALGLGNPNELQIFSVNAETAKAGQNAALTALAAVKAAIQTLALERGQVGAMESRLSVSVNNLQIQRDNFTDADSKIRSVDIAEAATSLAKNQILRDAAAAILAQANQLPQQALRLLGGGNNIG